MRNGIIDNMTNPFNINTTRSQVSRHHIFISHVFDSPTKSRPKRTTGINFCCTGVGRTGRNGLSGVAITLYQPSDDSDIRELEKMGITFVPKVLKNGEFQDTYDRDRRANREKSYQKLDTEMIGLVKKKKKKIKPGYKKKIQWKVEEKRKRERRAANRTKGRAERKAKKQTF